MEHQEISFIPLLVVIALAFFVPLALSRVQRIFIPVVVGEIVAGMIVGQSGLGLVEANVVLDVLASLGFVYLMFLSGLEISLSDVTGQSTGNGISGARRFIGNPFVLGTTLFVLALMISGMAAFFLRSQDLVSDPWIMALILSTTSLGVVVPVLKERGLTSSRYGQSILVSALVADFATILLISVYVLLRSAGFSVEILLVLVLFVAFVAAYRIAGLFRDNLPARRIFDQLSSATSQLKLRGSFALALLFVALAESLGVENILGAFLAGVVVSLLSGAGHSDIRDKLDAVGYSFFIPIFFVMVGVGFDLRALLDSSAALSLVPLLLFIAYIVKFVPALLYRAVFTWRQAMAAGALLSTRLSLIIAASAIGLELGLITEAVNSAVILVAVITCTVSPILFSKFVPTIQPPVGVLIVGGGRIGRGLAQRLSADDERIVIIESDPSQAAKGIDAGLDVIIGDATDPAVLEQAGIRDVRSVAVTTKSDEENLQICEMVKSRFGIEHVVARTNSPEMVSEYERREVRTMLPSSATAMILSNLVRRPGIFSWLSEFSQDGEADVREVRVTNRSLNGKAVRDLELPGDSLMLLIRRNGERVIPHGTTRLESGDIVTIAGSHGAMTAVIRLLTSQSRASALGD